MTTSEPTKESEFIFRRLADSFPQFVVDFGKPFPCGY